MTILLLSTSNCDRLLGDGIHCGGYGDHGSRNLTHIGIPMAPFIRFTDETPTNTETVFVNADHIVQARYNEKDGSLGLVVTTNPEKTGRSQECAKGAERFGIVAAEW